MNNDSCEKIIQIFYRTTPHVDVKTNTLDFTQRLIRQFGSVLLLIINDT